MPGNWPAITMLSVYVKQMMIISKFTIFNKPLPQTAPRPSYSSSKLDIALHDCYAFCVYGAQIPVSFGLGETR